MFPANPSQAETYQVWDDTIGAAAATMSEATETVGELELHRWDVEVPPTEVPSGIVTAMRLPPGMPFEVLANASACEASFGQLGLALIALPKTLSHDEQRTLTEAMAEPLLLRYTYTHSTSALVEPTTGTPVQVLSDTQAFSARPDLSGHIEALAPIVEANPQDPAALL